jgi:hypothetical protein
MTDEELERLKLMAEPSETWDLSDNDMAAIAAILAALAAREAELAEAKQQLEVLKPGGTYAWKTRAQQAEAELATVLEWKANAQADIDAVAGKFVAGVDERDALREALNEAVCLMNGELGREWREHYAASAAVIDTALTTPPRRTPEGER